MLTHQINWPTNISQELKTRLQKNSERFGLEVSIAQEIYEQGRDFYGEEPDFRLQYLKRKNDAHCISLFLQHAEAHGYLRVGYEILFFKRIFEDLIYRPIQDFIPGEGYEHYENSLKPMLILDGPLNLDIAPRADEVKKAWKDCEGKRIAYDVGEEVKTQMIERRKLNILTTGRASALLEDLLTEAKKEYEKRHVGPPLELLNFFGYTILGIEAGIARYNQLYQSIKPTLQPS